jgi:D-arabinono-1,4-lactone oxidase/FAD binding domain
MIAPDANGYCHPQSESEIIEVIQYAKANHVEVRVTGAGWSIANASKTDAFGQTTPGRPANINLMLDQMSAVTVDANGLATVGGGCNLGYNPFDEANVSTPTNNLFYQLNQQGWAIPNAPDSTHQTIAGFISTGSSGGSLAHSFLECVRAIRIIDGNAQATTFNFSADLNDPFYGVGVSMGLFGVIVSVTLQCIPAFKVTGQQNISNLNDAPCDFLGTGTATQPSLQDFLTHSEYSRIMWWPFKSLHRLVTWKARTMQLGDYTSMTGSASNFTPKPYHPVFPTVAGSIVPAEAVAGAGFTLIGTWPKWLHDLMGNNNVGPIVETVVEQMFPYLFPMLIDLYFPPDGQKPPQVFWDYWLNALPMDSQEYSNNLLAAGHTEMYVPISESQKLVTLLHTYYEKIGYSATGAYTVEVMGSKQTNFWLSPAYQQDSVRVNIFWFAHNAGNPMDYFQQFWDLLQQNNMPFRLHWGGYLPSPTGNAGPAFLKQQYPQWQAFMNLRKQMDPNGIFLNQYWKTQLGIDE